MEAGHPGSPGLTVPGHVVQDNNHVNVSALILAPHMVDNCVMDPRLKTDHAPSQHAQVNHIYTGALSMGTFVIDIWKINTGTY